VELEAKAVEDNKKGVPKAVHLNLSFNSLSGTIPSELATLAISVPLVSLHLLGNNFTGTLPVEFCSWLCSSSWNSDNNTFGGTVDAGSIQVDCAQVVCPCNCTVGGDVIQGMQSNTTSGVEFVPMRKPGLLIEDKVDTTKDTVKKKQGNAAHHNNIFSHN